MGDRWELRLEDPSYPESLRASPRPPDVLYGIGEAALLRPGLAVVGSRKATPYGLAAARMFAGWAAAQGVPVVSGAAMGCDQAAHLAALEAGGPAVAVLGCGPDVDYPVRAHRMLERIRQTGVVVSEAGWGSLPTKWAFPERNRIIAGLSAAVLVVEAALPSGTFSTADHALAAGRDVLAVPGSIFAAGSRGCNRLIAQGATPVSDVSELAGALRTLAIPLFEDVRSAADDTQDPLLRAIRADPTRPDDLARCLSMDVVSVMRGLAVLERRGVACRYPDGRYGPC